MAEARLVTNSDGIVTSPPRWAGRHINEVLDYMEGLEQALTSEPSAPAPAPPSAETPAGGEAPPKTPTAIERLAASAAARMDPVQQAMLTRAINDDEDSFAASVPDYETYKEDIHKIRAALAPAQLIQKGLHRTLYINVKTAKDKSVLERVFQPVTAASAPPPPAEPPASPPVAAPTTEPVIPRVATPRPAPPMAPPTPAARVPPTAEPAKAKLVATAKILEFCRQTHQDVDKYLLKLEANGTTQADLDSAGQLGRRNHAEGRTLVYDRPRASR